MEKCFSLKGRKKIETGTFCLFAHCSCCYRAPCTQCAPRTVGFPPRDRTGFVEERQLDLPRIFSGFVAANPQFCYSTSQAPQVAISSCLESTRSGRPKNPAKVRNPRDPIGKMSVTINIITLLLLIIFIHCSNNKLIKGRVM